VSEGWLGWDEYASFYDWENARTLGRRDIPFWRRVARGADGPVLELGCGTGRVSRPLARAGVDLVGIDRSEAMLGRLIHQVANSPTRQLRVIRGDIRALPFADESFAMVLAPYGVLQSLTRSHDLRAALADASRVLRRGGTLGIDLVPDVAKWREYSNREQLRGRFRGATLTLVESVRRDRARHLTIFDERFILTRGRRSREHRFQLTFRTLPVSAMARRVRRAGFRIVETLGDYRGGPWREDADVWILLARKV
jgi:ubiquinone/menaquinone biosynthesis C-methylase UbiE